MDGIYNAKRRAAALKAFFDAEYIDIHTLVDLGFGLGYLFHAMIDLFTPHTVIGVEPSSYAYRHVRQRELSDVESTQITLLQTDLLSWCQNQQSLYQGPFDLGICSSVFQYLTDHEIQQIVPVLAQRLRFLYFAVPIEEELAYQARELDFHDRYAIARTKDEYHTMLTGHFTIVSYRVLESKIHFDADSTLLSDLFYRF
ncbi:class I SAM-dependent methyltransferase [Chloroflexi bacterium TSY]|nr:class I SAM-dependent methyltransferase [Chloroflexi bacterium TSY]